MSLLESEGIKVTPARLGMLLSVIALLTIGWQVASYAKTQELTNDAQDAYITENKSQIKDMLVEMRRMNDQLAELVFISKSTNRQGALNGDNLSRSLNSNGIAPAN